MGRIPLALALLASACTWIGTDEDGDGIPVSEDCDDRDADQTVPRDWYQDSDGDGFGLGDPVSACARPERTAAVDGDCDDTAPDLSPGATEVCNGIDDDCDGTVDDDCIGPPARDCWTDADGDGYGDTLTVQYADACPSGTADQPGDCDDDDAAVSPAEAEDCATPADDDCDGTPQAFVTTYVDADGDGYGPDDTALEVCGAVPSGRVALAGDCDDGSAAISPDAVERCDGVDEDCDGALDPGEADADADGVVACAVWEGDGTVETGDCDDFDPRVRPGAPEVCDGADSDCDGTNDDTDRISGASQVYATLADALAAQEPRIDVCGGLHALTGPIAVGALRLEGQASFAAPQVTLTTAGLVASGDLELRNLELVGDAGQTGPCVEVTGGSALLEDVTFDGCYADSGAALRATVPVSVIRGAFIGNVATGDGGAVHVTGSPLSADSTVFTGNVAGGDGGAIRVGDVDLVNATLADNTAVNGGALYVAGTATLTSVTVADNVATAEGGGVYASGGVMATDSAFLANAAATGGALYIGANGSANLVGGSLDQNAAYGVAVTGMLSFSATTAWGAVTPNTPSDVFLPAVPLDVAVPAATAGSCTGETCTL